jgi:hypothetical protein
MTASSSRKLTLSVELQSQYIATPFQKGPGSVIRPPQPPWRRIEVRLRR